MKDYKTPDLTPSQKMSEKLSVPAAIALLLTIIWALFV